MRYDYIYLIDILAKKFMLYGSYGTGLYLLNKVSIIGYN